MHHKQLEFVVERQVELKVRLVGSTRVSQDNLGEFDGSVLIRESEILGSVNWSSGERVLTCNIWHWKSFRSILPHPRCWIQSPTQQRIWFYGLSDLLCARWWSLRWFSSDKPWNKSFDSRKSLSTQLTIVSRVEPLFSSCNKCTSSIMNSLISSIRFLLSRHFLVRQSHFSGVVIIKLWLSKSWNSKSSLSPVTEMQFIPKLENFLCQSTTRSSHKAFIGQTAAFPR